MPIKDFLIINIPVWLFYLFSITALIFFFFFNGIIKYIILCFGWWCFCGGVLVLTDYKRKKNLYLKIIRQAKNNKRRLIKLTDPLKDTICGFVLNLAIIQRVKTQ